jgi:hypothetical protein
MANLAIVSGFAMVAICTAGDWQFPRVRFTRRGGLRFLRVGRLNVSWSVSRNPI